MIIKIGRRNCVSKRRHLHWPLRFSSRFLSLKDIDKQACSGRAEDVAIAAAEIREAAEHFTVIRAQRSRVGSMVAAHGALGAEHGTVTVKVRIENVGEIQRTSQGASSIQSCGLGRRAPWVDDQEDPE